MSSSTAAAEVAEINPAHRSAAKRTADSLEQQSSTAAALRSTGNNDNNARAHKKSRQGGEPAAVAAASGSSAAASSPSVCVLYPDVLTHLLTFLPLQGQLRFSRVCRSWRDIGARAPALKALHVVNAMSISGLREMSSLLEQRLHARDVQARLRPLLCEQRTRLFQYDRATARLATHGLLPLLQSVQMQRVSNGSDGGVTAFLTVREPAGSGCSATSSAAAAAVQASRRVVRLSMHAEDLGQCEHMEHMSVAHWHIRADFHPQQPLMTTLLSVRQEWSVQYVNMQPLVDWLRECGVLRGSHRQQHHLLHAFLHALFGLLHKHPDKWLDQDGKMRCCAKHFHQEDNADSTWESKEDEADSTSELEEEEDE